MVKLEVNGFNYMVELIDGVAQGKGVVYYDNGYVHMEGNFVDGVLNGEHLAFTPNGELREHTHYHNGKLTGPFIGYYLTPNGERVKRYEGVYLDGFINGVFRTYFPNGNISCKVDYVYGEKDGKEITYFMSENYKISSVTIYEMGLRKQYTLYDINGHIIEHSLYEPKLKHIRKFDKGFLLENSKEYKIGEMNLGINGVTQEILLEQNDTLIIESDYETIIEYLMDDDILDDLTFKELLKILKKEGIC